MAARTSPDNELYDVPRSLRYRGNLIEIPTDFTELCD